MLADGLIAQARAGLAEEDGREEDEQECEIDHRALVEEQRPKHRDVLQAGDGDGGHGGDLLEVGPGAEVDAVDEGRERRGEDVDGHAVDGMVGAERDRGERVDHVDDHARKRAAEQAQPVRSRDIADEEADERADGGEALEADVDHARALAVELSQGDEQHGDGETDRCKKEARDPIHYASPAFLPWKTRLRHAWNSGSLVSAMPATEKTMTSA